GQLGLALVPPSLAELTHDASYGGPSFAVAGVSSLGGRCQSTFALRASVDTLRLSCERRVACHPKLAQRQFERAKSGLPSEARSASVRASEGWYRYGDSNPGPV